MSVTCTLACMVELAVVSRIVHHMGSSISLTLHAHRGRTAAVKIEGILRLEPVFQENGQFLAVIPADLSSRLPSTVMRRI